MTIPKVYLFPKLSWDTKKELMTGLTNSIRGFSCLSGTVDSTAKRCQRRKAKKGPGSKKKWRPGPTKGKASILVGWFYENPRDPWWIRCEIHPGGFFWFGSSPVELRHPPKGNGVRGQKSSSIITWFNGYHTTSHHSFPLLYWITSRKPVVNNFSKIIYSKEQNITHHRNIYIMICFNGNTYIYI